MTKLESIVVSNTEPNSKNVLWYDNKRLLIFSNGHWSPIVDLDDIDVDNLPNVSNLQEALKSLNIKVDNKVDKVLGKGLSTEDFTTEYKKIYTIGKSQSIPLMVHHDVLRYCYPQVTITATSNISELTIRNSADKFLNSTLRLKNISNGKTIIIDNENGQISGINYDYFNWVFFRLVDGINNLEIVSDGTFQLEIKYRETRRIR